MRWARRGSARAREGRRIAPAALDSRHGVAASSRLLLVALLATGACTTDSGTVGAPEHFSRVVSSAPVGPLRLQLWVWPKNTVFHRADSIVIHYGMFNPGPGDHAYRDAAGFYHFRVIDPHGRRLFPRVVSATDGAAGAQRILLYPGEAGEMHTINLACMPYHPYTFEPLYRSPGPYGCPAAFELREPGTHLVIGQRVPSPAFTAEDTWASPRDRRAQGEDTLPSHADTLAIEYRPHPWWRVW